MDRYPDDGRSDREDRPARDVVPWLPRGEWQEETTGWRGQTGPEPGLPEQHNRPWPPSDAQHPTYERPPVDPYTTGAWATDPYTTGAWTTDPHPSGAWTTDPHPSGAWTTDPHPSGAWTTDPRPGRSAGAAAEAGEPSGARHRTQTTGGWRRATGGQRGYEPPAVPTSPARTPAAMHDQSYRRVLGWTAIWYALPLTVYLVWAFTRSGAPDPSCSGAIGTVCPSGRVEAVRGLVTSMPQLSMAVLISVIVAVLVRLSNETWRASTIALIGAVLGGGLMTIIGRTVLGG